MARRKFENVKTRRPVPRTGPGIIDITPSFDQATSRNLLVPLSSFPADRAPGNDGDRELLARLRAGDEAAFDQLFRQWYPRLVISAEALLRDRGRSEEIVQDVMLELWRRRETLDVGGSAHAYLYQAIRNRALNHLRHVKIEQRTALQMDSEPSREASAPSTIVAQEMQVALKEGLDSLSPRCREVFRLSREAGLKYTEIAAAMDISVKTVEAQMGKALKTLREHLAPWLPQSDHL